jgi:hypothetical protein
MRHITVQIRLLKSYSYTKGGPEHKNYYYEVIHQIKGYETTVYRTEPTPDKRQAYADAMKEVNK